MITTIVTAFRRRETHAQTRSASSRREHLEQGEPVHRLDTTSICPTRGREEAAKAGILLKEGGYVFDVAFTSVLKRAIRTLWIALDVLDLMWIPVSEALAAERAALRRAAGTEQGGNRAKHGEAQVKIWRRSYDIPPPPLEPDDPRHPSHDPRYAALDPNELPRTESLKDTVERFLPYWHDTIAPSIAAESASSSPRTATACGRW